MGSYRNSTERPCIPSPLLRGHGLTTKSFKFSLTPRLEELGLHGAAAGSSISNLISSLPPLHAHPLSEPWLR